MAEYQITKYAGQRGYYIHTVFPGGTLWCDAWTITLWGAKYAMRRAIRKDKRREEAAKNPRPEYTVIDRASS